MKILSNTTVLSNFARIQQLTLLHRLFGTLYLRKIATLDQANGWLAAMIAQGYHAPLTDLSALIQPER
ncbi:hypothetical protein EYB53_022770 [Candidatus Chloroploca sp. M-50]|uniref:Uncharacterized protein n=1 Tax=Candidatus Chloroploca mongolica TaxID=2528176 RepID=A0ABS4DGP5_9CHLR|nr:hypothetical protein [Candidatus Chloroploca mongolica]MBP1468554.1 hypothetical protein [Candidatus Chloroploca mongolica]